MNILVNMKTSWKVFSPVLDQLFFSPLLSYEKVEDRAEAIENCLKQNGYTWDDVLNSIIYENKILA